MSPPLFTQLDEPSIRDHILELGRGDWGSPDGLHNPKWMPYVVIPNQAHVYGVVAGMPSVPAGHVHHDRVGPCEVPWDQRLRINLTERGIGPGIYPFEIRYYAASFFHYPASGQPDAWEWGHYRATMNIPPIPALQVRTLTVGAAAAEPSGAIEKLVEAHRLVGEAIGELRG